METILIVEDDKRLGEHLKLNLELRGYKIDLATTAESAQKLMTSLRYSACLLDIELPDGDGLELCGIIRMHNDAVPILMISARHEESIVVKGLTLGADDYLRKPFGMKELATRLEKLMNKHRRIVHSSALGVLRIDHDKQEIFYKEKSLGLSRREYTLLMIFVNYPGRIYTRSQLVDAMASEEVIQERTMDSHISHLRRKLRESGCEELKIGSVYGSGYRLDEEKEAFVDGD